MEEIETNTIKQAWLDLLDYVFWNGDITDDERGDKVYECLNTTVKITPFSEIIYDPRYDIPKGCVWTYDRLEEYSKEFIEGENPQDFIYTYGERLRKPYDQIQVVIDKLNSNANTRRATLTTWQPANDLTSEDVPCMILLDFKIRNYELNITGVWRSHDIYGAWFPNLIGLYSLANFISKKCDKCVGINQITVHSISAHINENNMEEARRILEMNGYDAGGS